MSNAQNKDVLESTTSYATIWSDTDWKKTYKYVNKQRHRIFRAESEGDKRKYFYKISLSTANKFR